MIDCTNHATVVIDHVDEDGVVLLKRRCVSRDGKLHVRCAVRVNGTPWLDGNAWNMHHTFGDMIERASQDSRIVPGDVIASGTIGGGSIGEAIRKGFPARYLEPGDVVEVEVEGIGTLRNTVGPVINPNRPLRFTPPRMSPLPEPLSGEKLALIRERTAPPRSLA